MFMSLPAETEILVVGAGPAGLVAALSLIHNGVEASRITVVDSALKGMNTSRAIAIHAATLEALDSIGCADKLVELGIKGNGWSLSDRSSPILGTEFSYLSAYTKFPFILLLAQTITEHVLEESLSKMGLTVIRPCRVSGMRSNVSSKGMDVLFDSGQIVRADYVIGADGARSVVRQLAGIGFTDPDGSPLQGPAEDLVAQMVLADVSLTRDDGLPIELESSVNVIASSRGMSLIIPLGQPAAGKMLYGSSEVIYRISFNVPQALGDPPTNPSLEYLQTNMDAQGPLSLSSDPKVNPHPIRITRNHWSTRFRTHSAIADVFVKRVHGGLVALVGDAAHIHSPAGGQGMNLGLRDAAGLGPVLAEHIRKRHRSDREDIGDVSALEEFAASRRKRGLDNITLTKRFMGQVNAVISPKLFNWPLWILRFLNMIPAFKRQIVWRLSGLGAR